MNYLNETELLILPKTRTLVLLLKEAGIEWASCKPQKICFNKNYEHHVFNLLNKKIYYFNIQSLGDIIQTVHNVVGITIILFTSSLIISSVIILIRHIMIRQRNTYLGVLKNKILQIFHRNKKIIIFICIFIWVCLFLCIDIDG